MACCQSCADGHPTGCAGKVGANRPRLIRANPSARGSLGFIGPMFSMIAAVNSARALGGFGSCPVARTAGGRLYDTPWTGSYPSYIELSDWYDKAEEELGRAAATGSSSVIFGRSCARTSDPG